MADIRFKDLTTTASSTASDDFIAIDGTTNGTRKLNAFSPTFGGNVVVTGTLTSQSTLSTSAGLSCQNADITGGYITLRGYGDQNGGLIFLGQSSNNNYILSNASTIATVIANTGITDVVAAGLRVKATTASTTTSTGALVVSGGVGIAGNAYVGGKFVVSGGVENTISGNVEFSTGQIRVTNAYTPLSASAAGTVGSITWDNLYIYVCVATNTWKRVAISTW